MQAPTSRDEGRYRQITVNVQLTANIFALRKILNAIETNTPYLFVDNLTVRTQVPANFRPRPGAEPEMFVQFDVSGYALTGVLMRDFFQRNPLIAAARRRSPSCSRS